MIALIAAAMLAQADGGMDAGVSGRVDLLSPIYAKCVERKAPESVLVVPCVFGICRPDGTPMDWPFKSEDAGYLLSEVRSERISCFVGACEAHRQMLLAEKTTEPPPPSWVFWAGGLFLAGAAGIAAVELKPEWFGLHR